MLTKNDKIWILDVLYTFGCLLIRVFNRDDRYDHFRRIAREELAELHEQ
jgi:hypothetical protein